MKAFNVSISKRVMRRKHRDGRLTILERYVLNYKDPSTGERKTEFRETRKEADARKQELYTRVAEGGTFGPRQNLTIAEAVSHWITNAEGRLAQETVKSYRRVGQDYIVGPALVASPEGRRAFGLTGKAPEGASWLPLLGQFKVSELTTAQIRAWYLSVLKISSPHTANLAKKHLSTVLSMVGEDYSIRVAQMPKRITVPHRRLEKLLLTQEQVKKVLDAAQADKKYGIYYAFLFLTGARPGEMLGLLWEDVDLTNSKIHIRRNQQRNGEIKDSPKTMAGCRAIPMVPLLREMLTEWKGRCPQRPGQPCRVFPALSGGPLLICNFRSRVWRPMLKRLTLPNVTPYVARHLVISNLQAQGVEVGLVARIAGHANPQVTLKHYTHQVRDGAGVMEKLSNAYGID